jgi:transposase
MKRMLAGDRVAGVLNHRELLMRFAFWYGQQHQPSVQSIRDRFHVSRATAYRWLDSARTAKGAEQP